jgi:hypothetical protein
LTAIRLFEPVIQDNSCQEWVVVLKSYKPSRKIDFTSPSSVGPIALAIQVLAENSTGMSVETPAVVDFSCLYATDRRFFFLRFVVEPASESCRATD